MSGTASQHRRSASHTATRLAIVGFYLFVFKTGFHYGALTGPELTIYTRLACKWQRSACLCLLRVLELKVCATKPDIDWHSKKIFLMIFFVILFYVYGALPACTFVTTCMQCPRTAGEGIGSSRTRVTDEKPRCGCWELNPGEEQPELLPAEPPL